MFAIVGAPDPAAARDAVYALEERIAEVHWSNVDSRDAEKTYNLTTPAALAELAPGPPWDIYLAELGIGGETELLVAQPSAFAGMAEIFAETPVEVWRQWLTYRLLRNNAPFLPKTGRCATSTRSTPRSTWAKTTRCISRRKSGCACGRSAEHDDAARGTDRDGELQRRPPRPARRLFIREIVPHEIGHVMPVANRHRDR
jgi:hypothetical protein